MWQTEKDLPHVQNHRSEGQSMQRLNADSTQHHILNRRDFQKGQRVMETEYNDFL